MKLTDRQIKIFWWLRASMLGLMAVGGVVAGLEPGFLPELAPRVGGFVAAIAGSVATWAGSILPVDEGPK